MQIYNAFINLSKIDNSKIVTTRKDGTPLGYNGYKVQIIINDEPDQYGNLLKIVEQQTQEERESGNPKNYLANGKLVFEKARQSSQQPHGASNSKDAYSQMSQPDNDLPF